jgi:hypothetical protein
MFYAQIYGVVCRLNQCKKNDPMIQNTSDRTISAVSKTDPDLSGAILPALVCGSHCQCVVVMVILVHSLPDHNLSTGGVHVEFVKVSA